MTPIHWRVLALVAGGYFFDVLDLTILGALVPSVERDTFYARALPAQLARTEMAHIPYYDGG
jgi:hypothetical protein